MNCFENKNSYIFKPYYTNSLYNNDNHFGDDMFHDSQDKYEFYSSQRSWVKDKNTLSIRISCDNAYTQKNPSFYKQESTTIENATTENELTGEDVDKSSVYADTNENLSDSAECMVFKDELEIIKQSIANKNTDLNKLVEEYIFAEIPSEAFTPEITTVSKNKGKRMWKRDSAKNTLENEYRHNKDWSSQEFRARIGKLVGYTQHQIYKWWAYRLTKDNLKVSTFSRKGI